MPTIIPAIPASTRIMPPTMSHNIKSEELKNVILNLKKVENADPYATLPRKETAPKKTIASIFSSIKKVSIRCLRSITPSCMQAKKRRSVEVNVADSISAETIHHPSLNSSSRKLSTTNTPDTSPLSPGVVEEQYHSTLGDLRTEAIHLHSAMSMFVKENRSFISAQSTEGRYYKENLQRLGSAINDLRKDDNNNVADSISAETIHHPSLNSSSRKLSTTNTPDTSPLSPGVVEEQYHSTLGDLRTEAIDLHSAMSLFAEENCSFIPAQSTEGRYYKENLQRLGSAINDLRKDDNNNVADSISAETIHHPSLNSSSRKLSTTNTPDTSPLSPGVVEEQYHSTLGDLRTEAIHLHSAMSLFAKENRSFISAQSTEGRYYKENLQRLGSAINDLRKDDNNNVADSISAETIHHPSLNSSSRKLSTTNTPDTSPLSPGVVEEQYHSTLGDLRTEAIYLHSAMMLFAEENCSFIPAQSTEGRYYKENLQRLGSAINDLRKDDNNSEINKVQQLIQSYHAKLTEFNQNDYPKQLTEINKKTNDLDNEMQIFAKENGNKIRMESDKYYYFEETIKRIIDRLDDLDSAFSGPDFRLTRKKSYKLVMPLFDKLDNFTQAPS